MARWPRARRPTPRGPRPVAEAAPRPLLLCADDYGLAQGIDEAIAALVQAGRLAAFSCISNGPAWAGDAARVPALRRQAQAGLHLNLSEGVPLSPALAAHWPRLPALPRLIADAHLGRLPLAALAEELAAQWQAFVDAAGAAPDFLDGHQHVHHLPGIRGLVLDWARPRRLAVRSTGHLAGPGPNEFFHAKSLQNFFTRVFSPILDFIFPFRDQAVDEVLLFKGKGTLAGRAVWMSCQRHTWTLTSCRHKIITSDCR